MKTSAFLECIQLVVDGKLDALVRAIHATPALATATLPVRATAPTAETFFPEIRHYMYGGDTALHMAAAAFSRPIAELLIAHGADCRAKNRRGAEPLHYAADANHSAPLAQADVIAYLLRIGADPNAVDKSGVAPLHRAVRTRSLAAVRALLDGGAAVRQQNKSGSTPLHLAVQTTGRGGSGSDEARHEQAEIVALLLAHGARTNDTDFRGKRVADAATNASIRSLLSTNLH